MDQIQKYKCDWDKQLFYLIIIIIIIKTFIPQAYTKIQLQKMQKNANI